MTTVHYVFWDSDNTLVETAEHHWRKHVEVLKTFDSLLDLPYFIGVQHDDDIEAAVIGAQKGTDWNRRQVTRSD